MQTSYQALVEVGEGWVADDGPGAPVDGPRFLELCSSHLPEATLSLGLTTAAQGRYTKEQLDQVLDLVLKHKVTAPVTLPIRASLATASVPTIAAFLNKVALPPPRAQGRPAT